jgi:hypothetical protein
MSLQLLLDSIDIMCASFVGAGETLSSFCVVGDDSNITMSELSKAFLAVGNDINNTLKGAMRLIFIDRVLKPIESILAIVPLMNQKIQDRKNVLLDSAFYKSKLQSELSSGKDNDHPTVQKLTNKFNEANKSLNSLSTEVINCIEEIDLNRPAMLGPEIAALVACMDCLPAAISRHCAQLNPLIPQAASTKCLLLASFSASESNLKSPPLIANLKSNGSQLPCKPIYMRPGALGGTTGGYGHIGFIEGIVSPVDSLLQSSSFSSLPTAALSPSRDSTSLSWRDSRAMSLKPTDPTSPSSSSNSTNPPSNSRIISSKRPVVKLGEDLRPASTRAGAPKASPPPESSTSPRPLSMPAKPILPPPKPPSAGGLPQTLPPSSRGRLSSVLMTASAAAASGSPRHVLGMSTDSGGSSSLETWQESGS